MLRRNGSSSSLDSEDDSPLSSSSSGGPPPRSSRRFLLGVLVLCVIVPVLFFSDYYHGLLGPAQQGFNIHALSQLLSRTATLLPSPHKFIENQLAYIKNKRKMRVPQSPLTRSLSSSLSSVDGVIPPSPLSGSSSPPPSPSPSTPASPPPSPSNPALPLAHSAETSASTLYSATLSTGLPALNAVETSGGHLGPIFLNRTLALETLNKEIQTKWDENWSTDKGGPLPFLPLNPITYDPSSAPHFDLSIPFTPRSDEWGGDPVTKAVLDHLQLVDPPSWDEPKRHLRMCCLVFGIERTLGTSSKAQRDTWMKQCDAAYVFTNSVSLLDFSLKVDIPGGDNYQNMWMKSRQIHRFAWKYFQHFDYFIVTGTDTYFFMDTLRAYIEEREHNEGKNGTVPLILGHRFQIVERKEDIYAGGNGYTMNKKAFSLFIDALNERTPGCPVDEMMVSHEDLNVGRCLRSKGVEILDTRDEDGGERFHVMTPRRQYYAREETDAWIVQRSTNFLLGMKGLSPKTCSFHYVKPEFMYDMYEYMERRRVTENKPRRGIHYV